MYFYKMNYSSDRFALFPLIQIMYYHLINSVPAHFALCTIMLASRFNKMNYLNDHFAVFAIMQAIYFYRMNYKVSGNSSTKKIIKYFGHFSTDSNIFKWKGNFQSFIWY